LVDYGSIGNQTITYNAFKSPIQITDGNKKISFGYNAMQDRSIMYYGNNNATPALRPYRKYYSGDGSMEVRYTLAQPANGSIPAIPEKVEFFTYIGGDAYSAPLVARKVDAGTFENFYLHRDYQGSILAITNQQGAKVEERLFDAWGSLIKLKLNGILSPLPSGGVGGGLGLLIDRGYTGHEHLWSVGLVHMNARLYDAKLHRFLQPDNFVQDPSNTQNYNRYAYCINNPLKYTDKNGEFFWAAVALYAIFFTDAGYEAQKYVSPVAFKVDLKYGTHQNGIGFDVSWGIPKLSPYAYRESYGATYYTKTYGGYEGWETRRGYENSILGLYHWGSTEYTSGEFSQTVGFKSIGIPNIAGFTTSNDLWGDGGDRYRTAHAEINFMGFRLGLSLFTGDPGPEKGTKTEFLGGNQGDSRNGTYVGNPYGDPDRYRSGVLYAGFGPINIGIDNEKVRDFFQNQFIHDRYSNTPHFRYLYGRGNNFFFQFGGSNW
jgi:RHS repeat-associated protein